LSPRVRHYGLPHRDLRSFPTRRSSDLSAVAIVSFSARVDFAHAASWNGIEPLKSRREDVLKILGKPSVEDANGALEFSVAGGTRSEEHTSELQSLAYLVCRLLLEKKKK